MRRFSFGTKTIGIFLAVDSSTQVVSPHPKRPNTLIFLPLPLTLDIPTPSPLHTMPSPEAEVTSAELSHPEFPVGTRQQINDGLQPKDWVSLETDEHTEETITSLGGESVTNMFSLKKPYSTKIKIVKINSETPALANPCAYGSNQLLLCQPAASSPSVCPGQQFCHIGDSPVTTVCCNKPGVPITMSECRTVNLSCH